MATLRFSFGTMGSGKSTLALQIHHNLTARDLKGLLLTKLDRDGTQITSRLGVSAPAVEVHGELDVFQLALDSPPLRVVFDRSEKPDLETGQALVNLFKQGYFETES